MGRNSQRRKERKARLERQARKRRDRRKKEESRGRPLAFRRVAEIAVGSNARHRQRLASQIPHAWEGESPADVAVFDDSALAALPPELAQQVAIVREALHHATESRGEEALKGIAVIARGSPLSDWRLFIRGFVDWLASDTAAADESWKRLDPERRPGRIATALMLALRADLDVVAQHQAQEKTVEAPQSLPWDDWDEQLLYHAKLVRRIRFDRGALRVAEAGTRTPEESSELLLGPSKIHWLREFIKEYGDTEPDLAAALAQAALGRAAAQNFSNVFDDAAKSLPGPRHDRRNKLLAFFYYSRFANDSSAHRLAEQALNQYLNDDLPKNEALAAPVRSAIASQIHLFEATDLIRPVGGGGMFNILFSLRDEDTAAIRKHFRAAVQAYPQNLAAYKAHVEWLEAKLDNSRLRQREREPLEKELAEVMQSWSVGLPDNVEPRLWLVDYLLENEQLEAAKPHVEHLAASRQEDPRVRATPWKWQLLEAKRLSRRKTWLTEVPSHLDAAEAIWPAWLSKQWLPYLRAAWMLRTGRTEAYENQRRQISEESVWKRDSLADACLMLGAAQQLQASTDELKRLRMPVEQALKQLDAIPVNELIAVGGFFWDLHRTRLIYPSYRLHGGKIGKALLARWKKDPAAVVDRMDEESIHKALLWCSECRFWATNYEVTLPPFYANPAIQQHPMFMAAQLNAFLKSRYHWGCDKYRELGTRLRAAAPTQRDAYYRYWFAAMADELDDVSAKEAARFAGFPFGDLFGSDDDDDDDEFGDEMNFDPDCGCPKCQAARRAYEQAQASGPKFPS